MRFQLRSETEQETWALLVRDGAEYWSELKVALEAQPVRVCEVRWLREAEERLRTSQPPQLMFTAVLLADGDWERILLLGKRAGVPVVVVSTCLDMRFCLDVLERGAFDFIVPPFEQDDVGYVVRNASEQTGLERRRPLPRAA